MKVLMAVLLIGFLPGCRSLAKNKEGPSQEELKAAHQRVEQVRVLVINSQLASDDDDEKDFWLSILGELGDYQEKLGRKIQR